MSSKPKTQLQVFLLIGSTIVCLVLAGCDDGKDEMRRVRREQQRRNDVRAGQAEHLADIFDLLGRYNELNEREASRQLIYHLAQWNPDSFEEKKVAANSSWVTLEKTLETGLDQEKARDRAESARFLKSDVSHLRDAFVFNRIANWVDTPEHDDPLFAEWVESFEAEERRQVRTMLRLFDWCVRNIAPEPLSPRDPVPRPPQLTDGLQYRGAGYRQTAYQCVWRGSGDGLQLAHVFMHLCRQANLPAAMLATLRDNGRYMPWSVGVLVGESIYLFDPVIGHPIVGPGGIGVATLSEARKDASVLRRMTVPGFFDYPTSKSDIPQSIAMLPLLPETTSDRMRRLQSSLTGEKRLVAYVDAQKQGELFDEVSGIAGVRLWPVPLQAEVYERDIAASENLDLQFKVYQQTRFSYLELDIVPSEELANGRWYHLMGDFAGDEIDARPGARAMYLTRRAPEFEIADLRTDVDLQKAYGVRRSLGTSPEEYDRQIQQIQSLLRSAKRTATYWLGLVQYDDASYETAQSWFTKRLIDDPPQWRWYPSAIYNAARTAERLGDAKEAERWYKEDANGRPHASRLRLRMTGRTKAVGSGEPENDPSQ
ncbi:MAG: hypothetical protein AAF664_08265 [Planctomycetota bacterium]